MKCKCEHCQTRRYNLKQSTRQIVAEAKLNQALSEQSDRLAHEALGRAAGKASMAGQGEEQA